MDIPKRIQPLSEELPCPVLFSSRHLSPRSPSSAPPPHSHRRNRRRRRSYVLTVLLDICVALDEQDLYRDVLSDARALEITPCTTKVRADAAETYQGAGGPVIPVPRLEYREDGSKSPDTSRATELDAEGVLLLTAACRSRHDLATVISLAPADED